MVESVDKFGTLQSFAECAEAVAATTKKLEKAAIVGTYLETLSDADLSRAARYFAGHQFASTDSRTTNVGGRMFGTSMATLNTGWLAPLIAGGVQMVRPMHVALAAGYDTHAAFSKAFRQHFGLSPSEFRQLGCRAATQILSKG